MKIQLALKGPHIQNIPRTKISEHFSLAKLKVSLQIIVVYGIRIRGENKERIVLPTYVYGIREHSTLSSPPYSTRTYVYVCAYVYRR